MNNAINLNPKQKIYLAAFFWLAILVIITFLVIRPLVSQIKNDGRELNEKTQGMELFYQELQDLDRAQKDYQAMQDEINSQPALLPASEALKFIVLIEKIAQATANQQTVSLAENKADKADPAKDTTDFQVSLRGKFPDLMKFLVYLENAPYYSDVKTLNAQRLNTKDDPDLATGDINTILMVSVHQ